MSNSFNSVLFSEESPRAGLTNNYENIHKRVTLSEAKGLVFQQRDSSTRFARSE
jgi:hypothetical protein